MAKQLVERTNSSEFRNDVLTFATDYILQLSNKSWLPACEAVTTLDGIRYKIYRINPFRYNGKERNGRIFRYYSLFKFFIKLISLRGQYDIFHAHTYYGTTAVTILAGLFLRVPVVVTGHSRILRLDQEISAGKEPYLLMRLLKYATKYVAISTKILTEAKVIAGIPENKINLIYNGVNTSRFRICASKDKMALRVTLGLPLDRAIIVFHGRLSRAKNVKLLIHGFNKAKLNSRAIVLLIGDGGDKIYQASLHKLVASLQLDSDILFLGSKENIEDYLRASDIYCLPSPLEGFSLALLEAMSSGLICLAADIDGNRDAIEDTINGFLFKKNSILALSNVLEKSVDLIGTPEGELMAGQARRDAETKFEFSGMVYEYQKLFKELVSYSTDH